MKNLVENGIQKYSSYVTENDVIDAIDIYNKVSDSNSVDRLLNLATSNKGKDYLMYQKCQKVSQSERTACFSKLYLDYPNGKYSAESLSNVFFSKIKSGKQDDAIKIGEDHLRKFHNVNSTPMVMFWLGKLYERKNDYEKYNNYYRNVIEKYPDSYYAYRAYLRLRRMQGPIISSYINQKNVDYPYHYTNRNIIVKLVELGDYDIVNEFAGDDDFIKSWVEYQKGNYATSLNTLTLEGTVNRPETIYIPTINLEGYFHFKLTQSLADKNIYLKLPYTEAKSNSGDKLLAESTHSISQAIESFAPDFISIVPFSILSIPSSITTFEPFS